MPVVQEYAKDKIVTILQNEIHTDLGIDKLNFQPFNTIQLRGMYLNSQTGDSILIADNLSASIDLFALINNKIVINSAKLSDFDIRLSKVSSQSPLNIQFIIDAFKPKEDNTQSKLNIKLSTITLTNGRFSYNVISRPNKRKEFDANHIQVFDLDAKVSVKSILSDSLNIQVKKISLKEKSGLEIKNLICRLITQDKKAYLKGFRLDLPSSFLQFDKFEVDLTNPTGSSNILDYAKLDCVISPSYILPKDISAFTSSLQYFRDLLTLQGHIYGTIDDLKADNLSLDFKDKMKLVTNAEIRNLRNNDKLYLQGNVSKLILTPDGVEGLVDNFTRNNNKLPKEISNLGTISFQGDISGFLDELSANGSLMTDLGTLNTDVLFGFNTQTGLKSYLKGKLYTTNFQLDKLIENNDFANISLNIDFDVAQRNKGKLQGYSKGTISDFSFKNYLYNDVSFDVAYDGLRFDGQFDVVTEHGSIELDGLFDLSDKKQPELNFKLNAHNIELDDLLIAQSFKNSNLSFVMNANFRGKDVDNIVGYIQLDSLDIVREDKYFYMDKLLIESNIDSLSRKMTITSDVINGSAQGHFRFLTLPKSIQNTLSVYLPALINQTTLNGHLKKNEERKEDDIDFKFQINNTEVLSQILGLPVTVINPAQIQGMYASQSDKFKVEVFTPHIKAGGTNIKSGYVVVENLEGEIKSQIDVAIPGKKDAVNYLNLSSTLADNLANLELAFSNSGGISETKGKLNFQALFSKEDNKPVKIDLGIKPSGLKLNEIVWRIDKSDLSFQGGAISVDGFHIYSTDYTQMIKVNGKYSKNIANNILKAELKNINLSYIFETLAIDALKFGGYATGNLFLSSVEGKPYLNTNLSVTEFQFNKTHLGTLDLFSELEEETNRVVLDGKIVSLENKETTVKGYIDPIKQGLSLNFDADSIDISFLGMYAEAIFSGIRGRGTGKVHLFGDFSKVTVEGEAFIQDGNIGIPFLNTEYSFSDKIYLKKDLIYFNDLIFSDKFNNKAVVTGKISHEFFSDFMYYIDLSAKSFLVYNSSKQQNPLFHGSVFGSGKGSIAGNEQEIDLDISMTTEKDSRIRMNFMEDIITEFDFITYKNKSLEQEMAENGEVVLKPIKTDSGMDINMNFYIDATPDASVEIVMDPVGGDILQAKGSGTIQFQWDTKNSPRLYGTYNISRGNYNFTFQRLLERNFVIRDGSSVQFNGDPFAANLSVNAMYRVTASLIDLDQSLAKSSGKTTIPVNCLLNLSGPLKHPNVGLDIAFPNIDPEVERQVKSLINTDDMLNRQVAYLLLLSKFYSPSYAVTEYRTSDFAAVASATLSNQLTKIVSQIDKRWQLGTNIRTSDAGFTSTEVELILSSQLLNNRLLINGNFGYRDDPNMQINNAFIGDVDLELLLNNSGSWRIKAYSHFNEKYYYTNSSTQTQGLGVMYKKDFDKVQELYFWKNLRRKKDKKEIDIMIAPDTVPGDNMLNSFVKLKK